MKAKLKNKKLLISLVAVVLVLAIGAGIFLGGSGGDAVSVYSFMYLGMTEYWGDNQESYGPVSTDKIQTIFLSDTQTVTEITVKAGDTVKKGDLLMSFDTTLDDLALERKRLEVEKLKLQLTQAETRLRQIRNMSPMEVPEYSYQEPEEDLGREWEADDVIPNDEFYERDGSSKEKAMICWLKDGIGLNDNLLEKLRKQAEVFQGKTKTPSSASDVPGESLEPAETSGPTDPSQGTRTQDPSEGPTDPSNPTETSEPTDPSKPTETSEPTDPSDPSETSEPTDPSKPTETSEPTESSDPSESTEETDPTESTEDTEPTDPTVPVDGYYVVFKVTEKNMSNSARLVWQGMFVSGDAEKGFSIRFFNADEVEDYTYELDDGEEEETLPKPNYGSGYTLAQIVQMKAQQEEKIKDLTFNLKMTETEYRLMELELSDGNVYAQIDGEVLSVLTEEEAKASRQPVVKVSGGGGFFVEGSVSELVKDDLKPGQEVTINDWNTGMTYTGEVRSVGDFPASSDSWNGASNPNATYYPFEVFIDGSADLQEGAYVSVMYSTTSGEQGIYLENPFVVTEGGENYVYVRGDNGKLEKRPVMVGKSLWGSYKEIHGDITEDDWIAFPYGKNIKAGAQTVESDISELYS